MDNFRGPSPDEKTRNFTIRVPESLCDRIDVLRKKAKRSRAGYCVDLIEEIIPVKEEEQARTSKGGHSLNR